MKADRTVLAETLLDIAARIREQARAFQCSREPVPDADDVESAASLLTATCGTCRWQRHDDPVKGLGHLSYAPFCGNGLSPSYQSHTPKDYSCSLHTPREEPTDAR